MILFVKSRVIFSSCFVWVVLMMLRANLSHSEAFALNLDAMVLGRALELLRIDLKQRAFSL